jgi:hypothetical protein
MRQQRSGSRLLLRLHFDDILGHFVSLAPSAALPSSAQSHRSSHRLVFKAIWCDGVTRVTAKPLRSHSRGGQ